MFNTTLLYDAGQHVLDRFYSMPFIPFCFVMYFATMGAIGIHVIKLSVLPVIVMDRIIGLPDLIISMVRLGSQIFAALNIAPMLISIMPIGCYIYLVHGAELFKHYLYLSKESMEQLNSGLYWLFTVTALLLMKTVISNAIASFYYITPFRRVTSNAIAEFSDLLSSIAEIGMIDFFSGLIYSMLTTYSMLLRCTHHQTVTLIKTLFTFKGLTHKIQRRAIDCDVDISRYLLELYPKQE